MEYNRLADGTLENLPAQNVDTGMGLERITATLAGVQSVYDTDAFIPVLTLIKDIVGEDNYNERSARIIADHLRAAVHMIADGAVPKNVDQGYVLRRLIRRAIREAYKMGYESPITVVIAQKYIEQFTTVYESVAKNVEKIQAELSREEERFAKTLKNGLKEFDLIVWLNTDSLGIKKTKEDFIHALNFQSLNFNYANENLISDNSNTITLNLQSEIRNVYFKQFYTLWWITAEIEKLNELLQAFVSREIIQNQVGNIVWLLNQTENSISWQAAFRLFDTFGFPIEMTEELAKERWMTVDRRGFEEKFRAHQELSRTASAGMFKGGLADGGEETTALHSATHIMLAGLRKVLGDHVHQAGSNITPERLRFDFTHSAKMNPEEIKAVEDYVNSAIASGFDTAITEESKDQARERGVEGSFWEKYPDIVKVYTMKWNDGTIYSQELCGGPHVPSSHNMGTFKIIKEEASSAWVRRIKAVLEKI